MGVEQFCAQKVAELQSQWRAGRWELPRGQYFVEIPPVHLSIQAFLVTAKTLLDFLAQLMSSERLIHVKLHGFHKKGRVVGGEVLHALMHKRNSVRGATATGIRDFIGEQKPVWIDEVVEARDFLAHPTRGTPQVMWELVVTETAGFIQCERVIPPHIGDLPFDKYAEFVVGQVELFAAGLLAKLRTAHIGLQPTAAGGIMSRRG